MNKLTAQERINELAKARDQGRQEGRDAMLDEARRVLTMAHLYTQVEIRRIEGHSKDSDRFLDVFFLPQVPERGEIINVNGYPYLIAERSWAVGRDDDSEGQLYAYLRVSPLQYKQTE